MLDDNIFIRLLAHSDTHLPTDSFELSSYFARYAARSARNFLRNSFVSNHFFSSSFFPAQ